MKQKTIKLYVFGCSRTFCFAGYDCGLRLHAYRLGLFDLERRFFSDYIVFRGKQGGT